MASFPHDIVLTSSPDGPITAYDTSSGTTVAHFNGSRSPRHGLALVGKAYIAASHFSSATVSGSIHLYNWWSTTALHHLPVPEPVAPLAATPDGLFLFAGGLSGSVHALSIPSGNIVRSVPAHRKPVSCLVISSDWSLLISGGDDGTIAVVPILQLVDASSGEDNPNTLILHSFVAHDGPIAAITPCMGLCHATVISCSADCTCKLWSLLNGTILRKMTFPCAISGVTLDPTETEFYAAGSDGLIYKGFMKVGHRKQVEQRRELAILAEKHNGAVVSVIMVNQGRNLVSAAEDGMVYIWDAQVGQVIMRLGNNMDSISAIVVTNGIRDLERQRSLRVSNDREEYEGKSTELCSKELSRPVKDTIDMEEVLGVAARDRRKAIDLLESAIGVYERLLELMLQEATGGSSRNSEKKI